ncbi:MAG: hypothetical protein AAFV86_22720, partial [Pseudomonadota bacterium]
MLLSGVAVSGMVAAPPARAEGACRYVVQAGDTLGDIAEQRYGRVEDFRRLWRENRVAIGSDPWVLEVGTVLAVPCREGERPDADAALPAPVAADPGSGAVAGFPDASSTGPGTRPGAPTDTARGNGPLPAAPADPLLDPPVDTATLSAPATTRAPGIDARTALTSALFERRMNALPVENAALTGGDAAATEPEAPLLLGPGLLAVMPPRLVAAHGAAGRPLQVVLLDTPSPGAGAGAVPGAACVAYGTWRDAAARGPLALGALIGRAGLDPRRPIVLAARDDAAAGEAAHVYWLLGQAGMGAMALMEGGHHGWQREGLPAGLCRVTIGPVDGSDAAATGEEPADGAAPTAGLAPSQPVPPQAFDAIVQAVPAPRGEDCGPAPRLGLAALVASARFAALDLPWGGGAIGIAGPDDATAALAWFALSEVARLPGVALAPAASRGALPA